MSITLSYLLILQRCEFHQLTARAPTKYKLCFSQTCIQRELREVTVKKVIISDEEEVKSGDLR